MIFLVTLLSACSTLQSGPLLLDDISLPFGRMEQVAIYKYPKNRFQVACPLGGSVVNKGKYGVSFIYMDAINNYNVFAYEPEGVSEYQFTLGTMLQGIKNMLRLQKVDIDVEREECGEYRVYRFLNFD